jgi:hypothetical protein
LVPYPAVLDLPHAYVTTVTDLPAERAPGLPKTLREHDPGFVLLDGTLTECDRVDDSHADRSVKHHRHDGNIQVITDPTGEALWISAAHCDQLLQRPGHTHAHRPVRVGDLLSWPLLHSFN